MENAMTKFSAILLFSGAMATRFVFAQMPPAVAVEGIQDDKAVASDRTVTADSQSNAAQDLDVTTRIRQSVIADKSLSTYAHNVNIVTIGGKVTLSGEVRSEEEKNAIEMKAVTVAGRGKVSSELKVAPSEK